MDPATGVALMATVSSSIVGILSAVNGMNKRTRAKLQKMERDRDEAEHYIYSSRMERRRHNEVEHSDCPDSAIGVPPLPTFMTEEE